MVSRKIERNSLMEEVAETHGVFWGNEGQENREGSRRRSVECRAEASSGMTSCGDGVSSEGKRVGRIHADFEVRSCGEDMVRLMHVKT